MNNYFPDRLFVELADHEKYKDLYSKTDSDVLLPFRQTKDIFIFSGILGWSFNERTPLKTKKELIHHYYLDETYDKPLILAAYIDSLDLDSDELDFEKAATVFEEYANFGFKVLYNDIISGAYNKTMAVIAYLTTNSYI